MKQAASSRFLAIVCAHCVYVCFTVCLLHQQGGCVDWSHQAQQVSACEQAASRRGFAGQGFCRAGGACHTRHRKHQRVMASGSRFLAGLAPYAVHTVCVDCLLACFGHTRHRKQQHVSATSIKQQGFAGCTVLHGRCVRCVFHSCVCCFPLVVLYHFVPPHNSSSRESSSVQGGAGNPKNAAHRDFQSLWLRLPCLSPVVACAAQQQQQQGPLYM